MSSALVKDAILRIGEVTGVEGRKIYVEVDKNKNVSDIFFDGDVLKNISVNSFIEIRKGFLSLIGKVDGEKIEAVQAPVNNYRHINRNKRVLNVSLVGYINRKGKFVGGTKELPLIGNEAYIITKTKTHQIHNLIDEGEPSISIAYSDNEDIPISFPIDGLFNTHIAIFGNTGSGKSNTLAILYQELCNELQRRNPLSFRQNSRFILLDFNGEYIRPHCITPNKKVYNLTTEHQRGDRIPIDEAALLNLELLSILADATEKTQKPFISRALSFYRAANNSADNTEELKGVIRGLVKSILLMSDKVRAHLLLDYIEEVLPDFDHNGQLVDIRQGISWHNTTNQFIVNGDFPQSRPQLIEQTTLYAHINNYRYPRDVITSVIHFMYLQLIKDVFNNRAQNEHIAPAINKLKSKQKDLQKLFDTTGHTEFWQNNFVVINLNRVNLDMKKTIPLLLSKKLYTEQKENDNTKSLTFIIDEAHNILSTESARESEQWKDYRLETFEEIIKEGRKFGVFITLSSQRPNDISHTITSQAHNYFIHKLINQKDLATISSAVSYIDRITEESIPTLPTGTCIFSGVAGQMPLKINIKELTEEAKPKSNTLRFSHIIIDNNDDLLDLV